jgi:quinol monooxygenase YgiN
MTTAFMRFTVDSYDTWKHVFDKNMSLRKANGATAADVHRDAADSHAVIVALKFKNMEAAKTFSESAELRSKMAESGVNGPPQVWFGEDIEHVAY